MKIGLARISEILATCIYSSENNNNQSIIENADNFEKELESLKQKHLTESQTAAVNEIETLFKKTMPLVQEIFTLNDYIKSKQIDYEEKRIR